MYLPQDDVLCFSSQRIIPFKVLIFIKPHHPDAAYIQLFQKVDFVFYSCGNGTNAFLT
jgi:hypothetical protein